MLRAGVLQGTLEVIRHLHFYNFSFDPDRPYCRLRRFELRCVKTGDAKDCYAREPGNDLFEQPHLFSAQLREIKKHSRHIAAWTGKALDISFGKRIALQVYSNDGNAGRCVPGCDNRRWGCCEDYVYVA